MRDPIILAYARTPFQFAFKGAFAAVRPDDLAAVAIRAVVAHSGVDPADVEDVLLGCAFPEGMQGGNVARLAALLAGLPISVPGTTISRFCGSSMSAVHYAAAQISAGMGEVFVAAGVESMSGILNGGAHPAPNPLLEGGGDLAEWEAYIAMGATAEHVAKRHGIDRAAQEAFALISQRKAAAAVAAGAFDAEIVEVHTPEGVVALDGTLRPATTLEGLAALRPVFDPAGTVTAGTASPLTDGAAALVVCSSDYAERRGLRGLARVRSYAATGCAPAFMGMGPVEASRRALTRAGTTIAAIDVVELNEAFASQALACISELNLDPARVNLEGGALALGHPLGATGARIVGKAAQLIARGTAGMALATQCVGGGQGVATVLSAID